MKNCNVLKFFEIYVDIFTRGESEAIKKWFFVFSHLFQGTTKFSIFLKVRLKEYKNQNVDLQLLDFHYDKFLLQSVAQKHFEIAKCKTKNSVVGGTRISGPFDMYFYLQSLKLPK